MPARKPLPTGSDAHAHARGTRGGALHFPAGNSLELIACQLLFDEAVVDVRAIWRCERHEPSRSARLLFETVLEGLDLREPGSRGYLRDTTPATGTEFFAGGLRASLRKLPAGPGGPDVARYGSDVDERARGVVLDALRDGCAEAIRLFMAASHAYWAGQDSVPEDAPVAIVYRGHRQPSPTPRDAYAFDLWWAGQQRQQDVDKLRAGLDQPVSVRSVRCARLRAGLTAAEVAADVGVAASTIRSWERGAAVPSAEQVAAVRVACGERPDGSLAEVLPFPPSGPAEPTDDPEELPESLRGELAELSTARLGALLVACGEELRRRAG